MTDYIFMAGGFGVLLGVVAIFLHAADEPRWAESPSGIRYFKDSGIIGLMGAGLAAVAVVLWIVALITALVLITGRAF
jgi:hypothetical protein